MDNQKKKVIFYGINRFQNKLENLLSSNYELKGYSDFDKKYENISTYEYKPFYNSENLLKTKFDYIVICNSNKKESEKVLVTLRNLGIEDDKIVQSYCLSWNERMFRTTFDDFININSKFDGLVFGMSYSRFAFLTHYFDKNFFKFSLGGVDLYTDKKWLGYLIENHKELLNSVKYVVLDLPYYIFNWDITSTSQIFYRMAYFDRFDDYRKFGESPSGQKYITSYRILKDMFSERFESDKSICSNNYYENGQMLKKANDASYFAASGIWYKRYENTIAENKEIFQEFINLINRINPDIKIAVVTYPYCQKFLEVNKEYVSNLQKEFYEIINSTKGCENIKIFDFIKETRYKFDDTCFRDATHFNGKGAELFSHILNKKFIAELYD
ncbi:MAG: hypothetical protein ACLSA2_02465 [Candidatus Gastranaerophilaceae bacterium]